MEAVNPIAFRNLSSASLEHAEEAATVFALDICVTNDPSRLICSLADFTIELVDTELRMISQLTAHTDRITSTQSSSSNPDVCFTSSLDGTIKIWDFRNPMHTVAALQFEQEVSGMALNFNDTLVATGLENSVNFFDVRRLDRNNCLGVYADVHTNEITQLKFHPEQKSLLFSGSEDGLLCCFDVSATEAEDTVVSIMNTECTVGKFGFFGPSQEGIYCISSIETLSLMHFPSAQRIANFTDIRENFGVEYLVDCLEMGDDSELLLLCGNHNGQMELLALQPGQYRRTGCRFNGHSETVRSAILLSDSAKHRLITSSEDGRMLQFELSPQHINIPQPVPSVIHSGVQTAKYIGVGPAKRSRDNRNISYRPY